MSDARYYTTPLGALVGLVLARQLVAKEDRNVFNQGAGAAAGAAAGNIAGGYLQDHLDTPEEGDTAGHMALLRKRIEEAGPGNRAELTDKDLTAVYNALPDSHRLPSSGIDHKLQPAYLRRMGGAIRAGIGKDLAAKDPSWGDYSKHYQGVADKAKGSMAGMNSASSNILDLIRGNK